MTAPLLEIDRVWRRFAVGGGRQLTAVRDFSLTLRAGESVGLVGESGSGKSTIGRLGVGLLEPSEGHVRFDGQDLQALPASPLRALRKRMQIIFQDPWGSLNPRHTIGRLLEEPLLLHTSLTAAQRQEQARQMCERLQLPAEFLTRFPAQLSGGQLQRVCIGRALATSPQLLVLDEPTSSLDVSVRAEILGLLDRLRAQTGVAMLFISHDLGSIRALCDRVVVLYLGTEVESGPADQVFERPSHPYTQALLSAQLALDPQVVTRRAPLEGEIPSPLAMPPGCPFATRCKERIAECETALPVARAHASGHTVRCVRADAQRFSIPTALET